MADSPVGISGRITRTFQDSQLTPLLALAALLLGVFAILVTPREEEPQIDVTFANVIVPFPGGSAEQVENLVTSPMEQILSEIAGVEHIVSASRPGLAVLTVQFKVGEKAVYPAHGVGVIERIENKEISGSMKKSIRAISGT